MSVTKVLTGGRESLQGSEEDGPGKFQGRQWVWPSRAFLNLALGHFGPENSLRGETVLCLVGCVVANVASLYCLPPHSKLSPDIAKSLN